MELLINKIITSLSHFAADLLVPVLILMFLFVVVMRGLIYYTLKREAQFAKEFEKRVNLYLDGKYVKASTSFYVTVKKLLERTYYEHFQKRSYMKRRDADYVNSITDRLFLIQHGCAWIVRDTLKQIRHLKREGEHPKFVEIVLSTFNKNPCFNQLFAIKGLKIDPINDVLNIMPGLFIVGGIFGTFLGIMKALPDLSNMNLSDVDGTKQIIDTFLIRVSFSMSTSVLGILFSILTTIFNTMISPEKVFINMVEKYENALDTLWNQSSDNLLTDTSSFDEHADAIEALAMEAVASELASSKFGDDLRNGDNPEDNSASPPTSKSA